MIPNLTRGAGIKGAALYVLHDERSLEDRALGAELTPDLQFAHRVGMTATRNLSTDDPELAWRLMCATARNQEALKRASGQSMTGRKAEKFCGHLSLSWEHQTQPDRAEMLRAAEGALQALGWEKLQALIVQHKDHDHAHVHLVVNLVDPETGRIAPTSNDQHKLQAWAHEYDQARGLNVCPERTKKQEARARGEQLREQQRSYTRREWAAGQRAANDDRPTPRTRAEKVEAYRTAVAQARDAMRAEWGQHYRQERAETARLDRHQAAMRKELDRSRSQKARVDFYNRHREQVWRGLAGEQRPGNMHTLTSATTLRRAVERSQAQERGALVQATEARKAGLVAKMETARQQAQREIFRQADRTDRKHRTQAVEEAARERIEARSQGRAQRAEAAPRSQAERPPAPITPTPEQLAQVKRSEAALQAYADRRERGSVVAADRQKSVAGSRADISTPEGAERERLRAEARAMLNSGAANRARERDRDRDRER